MTNEDGSGTREGSGSADRTLLWELWAAVPIFLGGGVLQGLLEAARDPSVVGSRQHLQGALLAGIPALMLGLAVSPALALLRRRAQWHRAAAWLDRATRRDRASDRGPVIRLHAVLVIVVASLVAWVTAARLLFPILFELQEQPLAIAVAMVVTTLMLVVAIVAVFAFAPAAERVLAWIDRRWTLPLPPWAGARYLLFVALPSALVLSWFGGIQGDLLGTAGLWIAFPLVLVSTGLVLHAWRVVRPRSRRSRGLLGAAVVVLWCVSLWAGMRTPVYGVEARSSSPAAALGGLVARKVLPRAVTNAPGAEARALAPASGSGGIFLEREGTGAPLSVVWVIIDALRADRVGAQRDGRSITPNLDRLAREAVVFERAYAQGTSTSYSIPSMLTGKNVDAIAWEWAHQRPQIPEGESTIAERLRGQGYQTALIPSLFIKRSLTGILQGYDKKSPAAGSRGTARLWASRTSPIATAKALAEIAAFAPGAVPRRPFFLTVYYGEPHAPYINHVDHVPPFPDTAGGRYDAEVAFVDLHLGQLIENLRIRSALWERTVLVVTADHGEAFGEHGRERHGRDCHVEAVHVPLLVHVPGVPPARITSPVALVDIVPTLLELTGAPRDAAGLSGRSLLIPMRAPDRVDPDRPIFCAAAHQRADQRPYLARAVRQAGYALIYAASGERALFDTLRDPGERQDLLNDSAHIERSGQLAQLLASSFTGNIGEKPPASAPEQSEEDAPAED